MGGGTGVRKKKFLKAVGGHRGNGSVEKSDIKTTFTLLIWCSPIALRIENQRHA